MAKQRIRGRRESPPKNSKDDEIVREELSSEDEEEQVEVNKDDQVDEYDEEDSLDEEEEEEKEKKKQPNDDLSESDEEDEEEEEGVNKLHAVGSAKFASAMRKLLGVEKDAEEEADLTLTTEKAKLFQRKTKLMKLNEQEVRERKLLRKQEEERKVFDTRCLVPLPEKDPTRINAERDLKRIATRGVVALFNAIGAHQRAASSTTDASFPSSKETFLKLLQEKATGRIQTNHADLSAPATETVSSKRPKIASSTLSSGWKVLQEDYLDNAEEDELLSDDSKGEDNNAIDDEDED
jgi:hypothetical protein